MKRSYKLKNSLAASSSLSLALSFILSLVLATALSTAALAADPGHSPSAIGPGTFEGSGNYTFPDSNLSAGTALFVNTALGRVGIGTTSPNFILDVAGQINATNISLATKNDATRPTLSFGDGDTGFYESEDDFLRVSVGGANIWSFTTVLFTSAVSGGPVLVNEDATSTNPTLIPDTGDFDTGIGRSGTDQLSLIAGEVEMLRLDQDNLISFFPTGNVGIGTTIPGSAKLNVSGNISVSGTNTGILFSDGSYQTVAAAASGWIDDGVTVRLITSTDNVGIGTAAVASGTKLNVSGGNVTMDEGTFFIDSTNDRVGIGTTSPSEPLHIKADSGHDNIQLEENSGTESWMLGIDVNGNLNFDDDGSTKITFEDGGNVGIGDSDPTVLLSLGNTEGAKLHVFEDGSDAYGFGEALGKLKIFAGSGGDFGFFTGGVSGTELMTIMDSGNVGIGTASPQGKLNVLISSGVGLNVTNTGTGDTVWIGDAAGDTTPFVIDDEGNVGIGTTSPTYMLQVSGGSNNDLIQAIGTDIPAISLQRISGATKAFALQIDSNNLFSIKDSTVGTERLSIDTSGNVGIGDTDPDFNLEVVGNFSVSSTAGNDGDRFIVDSSGNVGIGTTSPSQKLDVNGTILGALPSTDVALSTTGDTSGDDFAAIMVAAVPSTSKVFVRTSNAFGTNIGQLDVLSNWGSWVDFGTPDATSEIMGVSVALSTTGHTQNDDFAAIITVRMSSGKVYVLTSNTFGTNIGDLDVLSNWGSWVDFGNPGL